MSRAKLCGECLKLMQKEYEESEKELYSLDYFVEAIPDAKRSELSRAFYALEKLGIVNVQSADGEAYGIVYDPDGVSNLMVKKGAGIVKDVVGWVIGFLQ